MALETITASEEKRAFGYYAPIKDSVVKARINFLSWAETLPTPLYMLIKKLSGSNKDGPLPGALLGERDAFWFGQLIGASEYAQQTAAMGFISGYTHFFNQDHRMDGDTEAVRCGELAGNTLFGKLIESFQATANNNSSEFWNYFHAYMEDYAMGCIWEHSGGRRIRHYSEDDLRMVATRSAPVKIGVAALAISAGRELEIPRLSSGIDELVIALQIRDDLADCMEDFRRGTYTYVISQLMHGEQPNEQQLRKAFMNEDNLKRLLDESCKRLANASYVLKLPPTSALQLYLDFINRENTELKPLIVAKNDVAY